MAITTSYTRGVKYIKVSRFDANGIDQSTQLQNINNIRILFSDYINPIDYPAISITEYPDYYLYAIIPTDTTSSVDNEILNYKVSASGASISDITPSGYVGPKIYQLNNFSVSYPGSNPLGYFNTGTGTWALGNTPNITLNVTASITFTTVGTSSAFYSFALNPTNGPDYPYYFPVSSLAAYLSVPGAGTYTITLSGSITPLENTSYNLTLSPNNVGSTVSIFGIGGGYMVVTQSTTPYASPGTTLTVLEPYIDEEFRGSDCDILQNNVILNSPNAFYMVVDYNNGSIIATNQQSILSGSATRAQIQNWNYTYASQINGRYIGKEQNAIAYNVYTSASQFVTESAYGFTGSWPGDTTSPLVNGGVVVEYLDSCIYTTNWGGGGYPENANGGGLQTNDILLVGSTKDDVAAIPEDNISYFDTLTKNIPFGTEFFIKQYNQTAASTIKATSLYPGVNLNDATYWVPSNYYGTASSVGVPVNQIVGYFYPTGSGSVTQPFIRIFDTGSDGLSQSIPLATRVNGVQQTGSFVTTYEALNNISSSRTSGTPWFASLYFGSGRFDNSSSYSYPGSKPGLPPSTAGLPNVYQMGYPFEIYNITYTAALVGFSASYGYWDLDIKNAPLNLFPFTTRQSIGTYFLPPSITGYGLGLILMSGNPSSNFIPSYIPTPSGSWSRFSNIGPGYITTQYPKSTITQNANYITKTYGNNPNP
jgi:hypothetical protein